MSSTQELCSVVECRTDVITLLYLSETSMQNHPRPQWTNSIPMLGLDGTLSSQCSRESLCDVDENGIHGISNGFEDAPLMSSNHFRQESTIVSMSHLRGLCMLLPQSGAVFNIYQEKCDCPGRYGQYRRSRGVFNVCWPRRGEQPRNT